MANAVFSLFLYEILSSLLLQKSETLSMTRMIRSDESMATSVTPSWILL